MLRRALLAALVATVSALPTPRTPPPSFAPHPLTINRTETATGTVANDIANGMCAPVTLIFARGTSEPSNLGTVVGPPLASAMQAALGSVAVQGVDYAASTAGAETGAVSPAQAQGALMMANLTNAALAACPQTQVVLAGYSQGAEQVHGALENLQQGQVAVGVRGRCAGLVLTWTGGGDVWRPAEDAGVCEHRCGEHEDQLQPGGPGVHGGVHHHGGAFGIWNGRGRAKLRLVLAGCFGADCLRWRVRF
jgi:hypothetical protein